jgi:hypothetical protein
VAVRLCGAFVKRSTQYDTENPAQIGSRATESHRPTSPTAEPSHPNTKTALPIDTNFIRAHALQFEGVSAEEDQPSQDFHMAKGEFTGDLENHISRVTAKWKQQRVYIAVTNISGWFHNGKDDNVLR